MQRLLHIVIYIVASSLIAIADDVDSLKTMKEYYMNTITVTGTRTPKSLDNSPVVTRIITAEEIKKIDAANIKDVLLSEIPGVEFSFSMNQQVSMRMQGFGGMSILFLIDGERMAGETLDNIDFNRLNIDNVERIEIVKGAASALYGSNSVGAVINIITKRESALWAVQLNTRFGSRYGEQRHGGTISMKQGKVTNIFNLQYDKQDSYTVYDRATAEGNQARKATPVYGSHHWNFREKLLFNITDKHQLTARAGYYFSERNSSPQQKDRARDFSGGLRYTGQLSEKGNIDIGYTADRYDKSDYYPEIDKDYLDYKNVQHSLRAAYSHTFDDSLIATFGGDAMNDYLKSYQFSADNDHHSQQTADIFAQADWTIDNHWNIVAGLRADYFSHHGWEIAPKLAAMYKIKNINLRASYSKGFRAPTLKEMYMDFNMANVFNIYGNDQLRSERTNSFSLSAEYLKKYYCIVLTGYYNIIDNEITTLWDNSLEGGRGAMKYQNVEGTDLTGIDLTLMARFPSGINAKVCYSLFHEFPHKGVPATSDSRPHTLTLQLDYLKKWKHYTINPVINGRVLSRAHFNTINSTYDGYEPTLAKEYTIWKFSLLQKFYDAVTLTTTIDNIFNYRPRRYQYNSPFTLGTTFSVGLAVDVEKIVKLL